MSSGVKMAVVAALLAAMLLLPTLTLPSSTERAQPLTGLATSGQARYACPVSLRDNFYVTACFMNPHYEEWRREHGCTTYCQHTGMDLANGACGAPVQALADGVATFRTGLAGYGNRVDIEYADGWKSGYSHLSDFAGRPLQNQQASVRRGDLVGHVGGSGGWSCHLDFELFQGGARVDPWQYACWDIPYGNSDPDYCSDEQKAHLNPSGAQSLPPVDDVGYVPPDENAPTILPLAAKLDPNTYTFNPSFRTLVDYAIKEEYEALFGFASGVAEDCQKDDQHAGVNPCVRGLMAAPRSDGITFRPGNCTHDIPMPAEGFGPYEVCAASSYALPYAGVGLAPGMHPVQYAFALILDDSAAPPAVLNLRYEPGSEAGTVRVSWEAPAAEDIDYYRVTAPGISPQRVEAAEGTLSVDLRIASGTVRVVAVDHADPGPNQGPSQEIIVASLTGTAQAGGTPP